MRQEGDTSDEEFVNYLEPLETNSQTVKIGEAIVGELIINSFDNHSFNKFIWQ